VRKKNIDLNVLAVTSDMGSANQAMWKSFGIVSTKHNWKCTFLHPSSTVTKASVMTDMLHVLVQTMAGQPQ